MLVKKNCEKNLKSTNKSASKIIQKEEKKKKMCFISYNIRNKNTLCINKAKGEQTLVVLDNYDKLYYNNN